MNILLTGASGFVGSHIQQALQAQGDQVTAFSRSNGYDFKQYTEKDAWFPLLENVDAVINAVGIIVENRNQDFDTLHTHAPIALFQACEQAGVKHIIQISALGVEQQITPYQRTKLLADQYLQQSVSAGFVLRPSLVYGVGGASWQFFSRLAALPLIPVVAGGYYRVQPVHISDLVETVLRCLKPHSDTPQCLDVVGADAISFRDWLAAIRMAQSRSSACFISVPEALMFAMARMGSYVMPLFTPDNLRMLLAGNTADILPLQSFLKRTPLSIQEGIKQCSI